MLRLSKYVKDDWETTIMADWIEVGKKAPAFTLTADDGRKIRLSDLKGSPVVLYFYPKDDTPGCTVEAKGFEALGAEFADAGAERRRQLSSVMHELLMEEQRERRCVAEALRDRVGQSLTGLQLRLRALGERLPGEEARAEAQEMASLLEETICAARSLTSRLNAFVLHNLGLGAAIQGLLDDLNEVGIRVALECEEAADAVGGDLGTIAYGTVEELLSNVELHSQADRARVACAVRDGAVILTVTDNGVGFDGARAAYRNHRERRAGLRAISERLGLLGGSLDIDTAVGVGTRALVRLPLDGRPAGRAGLQVNT